MKSFRRSNRPFTSAIRYSSRAAKRAQLRLQIEWQPTVDADNRWAADMRHNVPGTFSLPPSMMGGRGGGAF